MVYIVPLIHTSHSHDCGINLPVDDELVTSSTRETMIDRDSSLSMASPYSSVRCRHSHLDQWLEHRSDGFSHMDHLRSSMDSRSLRPHSSAIHLDIERRDTSPTISLQLLRDDHGRLTSIRSSTTSHEANQTTEGEMESYADSLPLLQGTNRFVLV